MTTTKRPPALRLLLPLLPSCACLAILACERPPERSAGAPPAAARVTGRALEQIDSPPYTFLRLQTESGEAWVAIPIGRVSRERLVRVTDAVPLRNFEVGPGRRVDVVYLGRLEQ